MFDDDELDFYVVANHEEQYSIWPTIKDIPAGWMAVGPTGKRQVCLDYIERVWTDMRPKSLRDHLAAEHGDGEAASVPDEVRSAAKDLLREHSDQVGLYADGKPELYGWFVARIIESLGEAGDPDAVRAALDKTLPPHNIPSDYA